MSARQGLVSTLVDPQPQKLAAVNDLYVGGLAAFAPGAIIRAPLASGQDNSFPTAYYKRALALHKAHGLEVIGVLSQEFCAGNLNGPLGTHAREDATLNPAIDAYTLRAMAVARQLVPAGLRGVFAWNEPNLLDQPAIGVIPPPDKATALNPAVFGSLLYQTARRLKTGAQVPLVYAGALTCLEQFHTNPDGDWVAGYLDEAYRYLAFHGKRDYFWDYVGVNMEGHVDAAYALHVATSLRAVAKKHGHIVKVYVGEWGWEAQDGVDAAAAASTYAALSAAFDQVFFYAYHFTTPRDPRGYGAVGWVEANGEISPDQTFSAWYSVLGGLLSGQP